MLAFARFNASAMCSPVSSMMSSESGIGKKPFSASLRQRGGWSRATPPTATEIGIATRQHGLGPDQSAPPLEGAFTRENQPF
jgi:hypothetical protein